MLTVKNLSSDPMDTDNDGILNTYENDDGDSLPNKYDDDSDNNGIKDNTENKLDIDHDGINDIYDNDDDNDGIADNKNNESKNTPNSSTIPLTTQFTINNGRLLGSQCAQCHGTNGISSSDIDSIKGENNLAHEMYDDDLLMNAQAKGYTSTEIIAIEAWLNNIQ
jgi:hypothetical protein